MADPGRRQGEPGPAVGDDAHKEVEGDGPMKTAPQKAMCRSKALYGPATRPAADKPHTTESAALNRQMNANCRDRKR